MEKKARNLVDKIGVQNSYFSIELFNADDLIYDITKHELVPQHIPDNPEEKKVYIYINN